MVRIGVVNIDTSHPKAFSQIFKENGRARYAAVFNDGFRSDAEVEGFMASNGIEKRCASIGEMLPQVDVGFIQGCNWDRHLQYAMPFIEAGKPVFIDKPIVGNMKDIAILRRLFENGAMILGCSCMRYAPEIGQFLAIPEEERGQIVSVHSSCGVDEFNYAIHAVEAIGGLVGTGAISCQYVAHADVGRIHGETYAVQFASGVSATYSITYGQWQKSAISVMTTKKTYEVFPAGYNAMLDLAIDSVEQGKSRMASGDALIESILIMLAGRLSRERGGALVRLDEIPADYNGFDGYEFERDYAAAAGKMYAL